ncbi:hypothetical protein U14_04133 [Candidatus Moduliflexus flocculans]|uniref:TIR domain-containing protein n=1 Tax=Candidatus Moduliflexus flocculans TaxID=1499966 RepID=A0A0S6W3I9_9BACT|nr:hypothetical protein U14_04133 [Candidatus Moduliflexus flocculans]
MHEYFLPFLQGYLDNALNKAAQVFYDIDGISAGEDYPARLKQALARSKCLIAIWSPLDFRSSWCQYECNVIRYREQQLQYRTLENPNGLIFPVVVHDGEYFPDYAKRTQFFDCREYARVGSGFKKTKGYAKFQTEMIDWTTKVADGLHKAPEWIADMETDVWLNNPLNQSLVIDEPIFRAPTLE